MRDGLSPGAHARDGDAAPSPQGTDAFFRIGAGAPPRKGSGTARTLFFQGQRIHDGLGPSIIHLPGQQDEHMPVGPQRQHAPHGDLPRMALQLVDIIGPGADIRRIQHLAVRFHDIGAAAPPLRPVTRLTMMPASGESKVTEPLSRASMLQPSGMSTVKKLSASRGEATTKKGNIQRPANSINSKNFFIFLPNITIILFINLININK